MTALSHGGYSLERIRSRARSHRRRFLQRLDIRAADLDAVTRERLMAWSLAAAQCDLLLAGGQAGTRNYWTGMNLANRQLIGLEQRLRDVGLDKTPAGRSALESYLANGGGA